MSVDVLAIGAHPDDVELTIGGTIAKLTATGKRVAILDMTRGEMGTRGTPEQRAGEAAAAAEVLGVCERVNLGLPDGWIEFNQANHAALVGVIRRLRPTLVMAHWREDLHPDHVATAKLVESVMYPSGFVKHPAGGEPWRPHEYLFYMAHYPFEPSFIVDVTDYHEVKMKAMRCYSSQLHKPGVTEPDTWIGRPDFEKRIEARAIHYGSLIQRPYGEPFRTLRAVPMGDPLDHYRAFPKV